MFSAFHKLNGSKYDITSPFLCENTYSFDNSIAILHRFVRSDDGRYAIGDSAANPTTRIK